MPDAKKASLTVLGGPLGGVHVLLPDDGVVTIGSAADCSFRLNIPSVSPLQARVVLEHGVATVHSTGAGPPLHINDNPLGSQGALRNGDILWLGVPGGDDVVMLQCILPPPGTSAPAPAATLAEPTPDIETQTLWAVSPPPATPAPPTGEEPTLAFMPGQILAAEEAARTEAPSPPEPEPQGEEDPLLMVFDSPVEQETVVVSEPELVTVDDLAPVDLGDSEEAVVVDEDELLADATPTFIASSGELTPPAEEERPTEALVPPEPAPAEPPETPPVAPVPVAASTPETPPPAAPETPAPAPPPAPAPSPPAVPDPPPGSVPDASHDEDAEPSAEPALPDDEFDDDYDAELDEEEAPSRNPVVLALAGFVGVLAVAILGWVIWRFVVSRPAAQPSPAPVAAAAPAPPAVSTPPPPAAALPPAEPTPEPTAAPSVMAPPTTDPPPAASAVPQPTPTPRPAPPPAPPPASVPAAPPQPSAEELRAQETAARIERLLGQADTALAARQYDAAITHLTEVLTLDPAHSRARTTMARASALLNLASRRFVATRTRVQTEKEQEGGLAGFDTGATDLRKAPDFQGRIEFEMTPASGIGAGDPWSLRIFVVNEGDKPIRIQGIEVVSQVNGAGSGRPVPPRTRQVPTQQRALVGELSGTWGEGTNAWTTQVTVTANNGDSLRASITWR